MQKVVAILLVNCVWKSGQSLFFNFKFLHEFESEVVRTMLHQTASFNENKGKPDVVASHLCNPQQQVIPLKPWCTDGLSNSYNRPVFLWPVHKRWPAKEMRFWLKSSQWTTDPIWQVLQWDFTAICGLDLFDANEKLLLRIFISIKLRTGGKWLGKDTDSNHLMFSLFTPKSATGPYRFYYV